MDPKIVIEELEYWAYRSGVDETQRRILEKLLQYADKISLETMETILLKREIYDNSFFDRHIDIILSRRSEFPDTEDYKNLLEKLKH